MQRVRLIFESRTRCKCFFDKIVFLKNVFFFR